MNSNESHPVAYIPNNPSNSNTLQKKLKFETLLIKNFVQQKAS